MFAGNEKGLISGQSGNALQWILGVQMRSSLSVNVLHLAVATVMAWPFAMGRKNLARARESIISSLSLVTKSGVYRLGINQTLKALRSGEAKLVIFASNIAPAHKSLIEYYAMLSQCDILPFDGDNVDLGTACGKYFRSSVIAIINAGESEILKMIKEKPE